MFKNLTPPLLYLCSQLAFGGFVAPPPINKNERFFPLISPMAMGGYSFHSDLGVSGFVIELQLALCVSGGESKWQTSRQSDIANIYRPLYGQVVST